MAGGLGNLTIGLGLDAAEFTRGLTRAQAEAKQRSEEIASTFSKAGVAIGAALAASAAVAVDAITSKVKEALAAVDAFNDLKDATGASIENISAIDRVARETGVHFDTVSTALVKLNQALTSVEPDSPTAKALARIGLSAQELRNIDPAEALRRVAVALSQFSDDGNKARLVQELFGKSLKDVAPLLNDLAEKTQLTAKVSTEGALEIEKFRKEIFQLQANSQDLARSLTIDAVTGINSFIKTVREGRVDIVEFHKDLARAALTAASFGLAKRPTNQDYSNEGRGSQNPNFDYSNEGRSRRSVGDPAPKPDKVRAPRKEVFKDQDQHIQDYLANQKRLDDALADSVRAGESYLLQQQNVLQGFGDEARAAREAAEAFGLTHAEVEQLTIAKRLAAAASLELLAINKEETAEGSSVALVFRQQAEALREAAAARAVILRKQTALENDPFLGATQAVKDYLAEISKAGTATEQVVGDALRSIEDIGVHVLSGKSIKQQAKALVNQLIAEFYRLAIIRPLMQSLFGGSGGSGFATTIAGLIGTAGASANGSRDTNYGHEGARTGNGPSFGKGAVPGGSGKMGAINLYNAPAGSSAEASVNSDGSLDIKLINRLVDARISKSVAPGGAARRGLKTVPPERG